MKWRFTHSYRSQKTKE